MILLTKKKVRNMKSKDLEHLPQHNNYSSTTMFNNHAAVCVNCYSLYSLDIHWIDPSIYCRVKKKSVMNTMASTIPIKKQMGPFLLW